MQKKPKKTTNKQKQKNMNNLNYISFELILVLNLIKQLKLQQYHQYDVALSQE